MRTPSVPGGIASLSLWHRIGPTFGPVFAILATLSGMPVVSTDCRMSTWERESQGGLVGGNFNRWADENPNQEFLHGSKRPPLLISRDLGGGFVLGTEALYD